MGRARTLARGDGKPGAGQGSDVTGERPVVGTKVMESPSRTALFL